MMPPMPSELLGAVIEDEPQGLEDMLGALGGVGQTLEVSDAEMDMDTRPKGSGRAKGKKGKAAKPYNFDLDIKLPVESESVEEETEQEREQRVGSFEGVMPLPDLKDLSRKSEKKAKKAESLPDKPAPVSRKDIKSFTRLLELDPEADSDDTLFTTPEYDSFSAVLGESRPFLGIPNAYIQIGHLILLVASLVCGLLYTPGAGFPLTELPKEIRSFIQEGLLITYAINAVISFAARGKAEDLKQPVNFWGIKCFLLGGLAYNELTQLEELAKQKPVKGSRAK
ncbi:unnamed protein product [Chrysoparadoxa australica]